jgi:hypothetical protein
MSTPFSRSAGRSLAKSIESLLLLLLLPLVVALLVVAALGRLITWPLYRRWKQRPFDATIWKNNPPHRGNAYTTEELARLDPSGEKQLPGRPEFDTRDARYWMVDDLRKQIHGKSREEVVALLGEPISPSPFRFLLEDKPESWHLAYELTLYSLFGTPELLIRLDEQGRVKEAKVGRSTT